MKQGFQIVSNSATKGSPDFQMEICLPFGSATLPGDNFEMCYNEMSTLRCMIGYDLKLHGID